MRWKHAGTGLILGLMTLAFSILSFAQVAAPTRPGDFKVRAIRQQLVLAPQFSQSLQGQGTSGSSLQKKWLRIETEFDCRPEWADDLMFKYYVLVGRDREAKMFVGEVTYINVAKGNRRISAMFMHPNTVERYGQGRVEAVGVEVFHQGRIMDEATDPVGRPRWWRNYTPVQGFLLNPQQTPWSFSAYERYEQVKPTP